MTLCLDFEIPPPRSAETTRHTFAALAATLLGDSVVLEQVSRETLKDPNFANACYRAAWRADRVRYESETVAGSGNPRDGFGYESKAELVVEQDDGGEVVLRASDCCYEPCHTRLRLLCCGIDGTTLARLRQTLRRELGDQADHSHEPWLARTNAEVLLERGEREVGLALVREALLAHSADVPGRAELMEWLAGVSPGEVDLSTRLREAPAMVAAWRDAVDQPPSGFGSDQARRALARLCPFDPELVVGPWHAHPLWPLEPAEPRQATRWRTIHMPATYVPGGLETDLSTAIIGRRPYQDWHEVYGEQLEGRRGECCRVVRFAAHHDSRGLDTQVTLQVRNDDENLRWVWIAGPDHGDFLLVVRRNVTGPADRQAITWCSVGTAEFLALVEEKMRSALPYRIHDVDVGSSLSPRGLPRPTWWADGGGTEQLLHAALEHVDLPTKTLGRVSELLATCQCYKPAKGYCEHREELLALSRAARFGGEWSRARSQALEAAFYAAGAEVDRARVQDRLERVRDQLAALTERWPASSDNQES